MVPALLLVLVLVERRAQLCPTGIIGSGNAERVVREFNGSARFSSIVSSIGASTRILSYCPSLLVRMYSVRLLVALV